MKLPHLDQLVPLGRGDAGVLATALDVLVRDTTESSRPVVMLDAMLLPSLATLAKKLRSRHDSEMRTPVRPGKRPKPRLFRLSYDQVALLMHYRHVLRYCGLSVLEQHQLQVALGEVQRYSLNLEHIIKFPKPASNGHS